jgi:hypothetical protein
VAFRLWHAFQQEFIEALPEILELGDTPAGNRRVFTVSGGKFIGDHLRGEVLPQGPLGSLVSSNGRVFSAGREVNSANR